MVAKVFDLLNNLTDNDTLIIIFIFVLAMFHPAKIDVMLGILGGFIGAKVTTPKGGTIK